MKHLVPLLVASALAIPSIASATPGSPGGSVGAMENAMRAASPSNPRDRNDLPPGLKKNPGAAEKVSKAHNNGNGGQSAEGNRPAWHYANASAMTRKRMGE